MSEHAPQNNGEFQPKNLEHERPVEHTETHNTHEREHTAHGESIDIITKKVESHAKSHKETAPHAVHEKKHHPVLVNKNLKDIAYSRTMTRVRKKLSAPSRAFSAFTHSPLIDKPSEFASKTVARPSGMLGGALFALGGTLLLLWTVNTYGYEYNYLGVVALFVGGALFGLVAEGFIRFLKR